MPGRTFCPIRPRQQADRVHDSQLGSRLFESSGDLQMASWVAEYNDLCTGSRDVLNLALEQRARLIRLGQRVDPRGAAAPRRLSEFNQRESGYQAEQGPRLTRDFLSVDQVTRLAVRHRRRLFERRHLGSSTVNLDQPLLHVSQLRVPHSRALAIPGIVGK